jgi:hypothetical protein
METSTGTLSVMSAPSELESFTWPVGMWKRSVSPGVFTTSAARESSQTGERLAVRAADRGLPSGVSRPWIRYYP